MTVSESGDSRPGSSAFNGSESPNPDQFPETIYNPRKRPREVQPAEGQHLHPDQAAMEITPAPPPQQSSVFRSLKEKTSSIWSPHLHTDRRASRYSVWDPPSVSWSADSGILGRRNIQVVLFILGFILPLGKTSLLFSLASSRIRLSDSVVSSVDDRRVPSAASQSQAPNGRGRPQPEPARRRPTSFPVSAIPR